MEQLDKAARNIHFAWAGGTQPGDPHYYRVQTPLFLIELDPTPEECRALLQLGLIVGPRLAP